MSRSLEYATHHIFQGAKHAHEFRTSRTIRQGDPQILCGCRYSLGVTFAAAFDIRKGTMKKITTALVQRCLSDIDIVTSSPLVKQFIVGYTSNIESRRASYRRVGIPHFFVLATSLSYGAALEIEQSLFNQCVVDKQSLRYLKYHEKKRDKGYSRSSGGKNAAGMECTVYIACFGS